MKKIIVALMLTTVFIACNNTPVVEEEPLPDFVPDTDGECCEDSWIQGFDSLPYPDDSIAVNF